MTCICNVTALTHYKHFVHRKPYMGSRCKGLVLSDEKLLLTACAQMYALFQEHSKEQTAEPGRDKSRLLHSVVEMDTAISRLHRPRFPSLKVWSIVVYQIVDQWIWPLTGLVYPQIRMRNSRHGKFLTETKLQNWRLELQEISVTVKKIKAFDVGYFIIPTKAGKLKKAFDPPRNL